MTDFNIVDVPAILRTPVGDDGSWHREGSEAQFVLAEFLAQMGLLANGVMVERIPELTIKFSELTLDGQQFAREAVHKWLVSVDRLT